MTVQWLERSDWRAAPPTPLFVLGTRLLTACAALRKAAPPPLVTLDIFMGFMRGQVSNMMLPAPLASVG